MKHHFDEDEPIVQDVSGTPASNTYCSVNPQYQMSSQSIYDNSDGNEERRISIGTPDLKKKSYKGKEESRSLLVHSNSKVEHQNNFRSSEI